MKAEHLVQCNHGYDPDCKGCIHSVPHDCEVQADGGRCTQWGECLLGKDRMIKVRCVKAKELKDSNEERDSNQ